MPSSDLVRRGQGAPALPEDKVLRVVKQFFSRRSPYTVEGYRQDMIRFAEYLQLVERGATKETREQALNDVARHLFSLSAVDANYTVMQYVAYMEEQSVAPATINRRLAALRSFVKLGQVLGAISWSLGVRGVKAQKMRDVAGPTVEQVRAMMAAARAQTPAPRACRDTAILALFFTLGLRGVEVRELMLEHLDLAQRRVLVRGKGRAERAPQTFPPYVTEALQAWLRHRGVGPGPLFFSLSSHKSTGVGLTRKSVWTIIKTLGDKVGIRAWPHGLRHTAITETLEMLGGDVRKTRQFSRHERVQTVMDYDDARRDVAGDISGRLAQRLSAPLLPKLEHLNVHTTQTYEALDG